MRHDETIRQGVTFYREVIGITCKGRTKEQVRAMTPRATILGTDIVMPCAWLSPTEPDLAWTLPRGVTPTLDPERQYEYNLDLYNDTDTIEVLTGFITPRKGQSL